MIGGLELAVADLVKNYLFSQAGERLDLFKKVWGETSLLVGSENLTVLDTADIVRDGDVTPAIMMGRSQIRLSAEQAL